MPAVNPEMELARQEAAERIAKGRLAQLEAADSLIVQCEEAALPWLELTADVRERICRQVQLAHNGRCYNDLADLLGVDPVDRRFCAEQVAGHLKSSTELLLEDSARRRAEPLPAALLLRFLREHSLLRVLADVAGGVREACARRRQQELLSRASCSPMDSGYQSSDHCGSDIVGVLSEPPDASLVKAIPVRSEPPTSPTAWEADLKKPTQYSKKLMLTYAYDGRETALEVAKQLKGFGFRVMMLEEQNRHRYLDSYSAVKKWFTGVDYIVPVLTAEYFAATQNLSSAREEPARRLAADARFVYTLMCAEMESNMHVNYRVRAVMPDGAAEGLSEHPLFGSPLFRFPFSVSELDMLAECLED
ncbi:uncharacterized protein LOC122363895 [Amphibalanus amphitrite]|uniref:uncharacterized protein LOC122363895 n=1 Tax=Amphibalanus amphitrite TaxID=1232801 RepID=UPI001C90F635|nr:uncharacterized protein LOC122363895 [Amphibalanus amphitrite]